MRAPPPQVGLVMDPSVGSIQTVAKQVILKVSELLKDAHGR